MFWDADRGQYIENGRRLSHGDHMCSHHPSWNAVSVNTQVGPSGYVNSDNPPCDVNNIDQIVRIGVQALAAVYGVDPRCRQVQLLIMFESSFRQRAGILLVLPMAFLALPTDQLVMLFLSNHQYLRIKYER